MTTKYTEDHEWVRMDGDLAVVGISRFAAKQLGDVVFVELPDVGKTFARGKDMAVVESAKAASDVYAPISGEIVAVNAPLMQADDDARNAALALIASAPESDGWFVRIRPSDPSELDALMDSDAYKAHTGG